MSLHQLEIAKISVFIRTYSLAIPVLIPALTPPLYAWSHHEKCDCGRMYSGDLTHEDYYYFTHRSCRISNIPTKTALGSFIWHIRSLRNRFPSFPDRCLFTSNLGFQDKHRCCINILNCILWHQIVEGPDCRFLKFSLPISSY